MAPKDPMEGHSPNLTTSDSDQDPRLPPGVNALPRDPNQPIQRKPRVFVHRPNEDPSEEISARENTSIIAAARTIGWEDFGKLGQMPCFRDAMLPSISGGVGIGIARFVVGGSIFAACNWASGSFLGISVVAYNMCQRARRKEKDSIRQAVKVLDEKQKLKEAEAAAAATQANSATGGGATNFWSTFKFW